MSVVYKKNRISANPDSDASNRKRMIRNMQAPRLLEILLYKVISVVHCIAISFYYYGIEFVKLKSKRPKAKQATD